MNSFLDASVGWLAGWLTGSAGSAGSAEWLAVAFGSGVAIATSIGQREHRWVGFANNRKASKRVTCTRGEYEGRKEKRKTAPSVGVRGKG